MKVMVFKVNTQKPGVKNKRKWGIEKILFLFFLIAFTLLVVVQTAFLSPSVKSYLGRDLAQEGTPLGAEAFLYLRGEICLEMQNTESNHKLVVLVNGEPVANFVNKAVTLKVKDGDLVELDGSELQESVEVRVVSISENIQPQCLGKRVVLHSGVQSVAIIRMNQN